MSDLVEIVNNAIIQYKKSDDYARRCLLKLDDSVNIELLNKDSLELGIISVEYTDNTNNIIIHITTDFLRDEANNNYKFETLCQYRYTFSIDEVGRYWGLDRINSGKIIVNNLFYSLSKNVILNCKLLGVEFHENILEGTLDEIIGTEIIDLDKYISLIDKNKIYLQNCNIYFANYCSISCDILSKLYMLEQSNIFIFTDKLNLCIMADEETEEDDGDIILAYKRSINKVCDYMLKSGSSFSIDYINFHSFEMVEYDAVIIGLQILYNFIKETKFPLHNKIDVYASLQFDDMDDEDEVCAYYNDIRKELDLYKDIFATNYFDNKISKWWKKL